MAQQSITLQTSDADVVSGDVLGRVNFAASNESSGSEAKWIGASVFAEASGEFTASVNPTNLVFATSDSDGVTARLKLTNIGHLWPNITNTYDLGSSTFKYRAAYATTGVLDYTGINTASPIARLHIETGSAAISGILVRGAPTQTADLFQAQNTSSGVLTRITSDGSISGVASGIFMQRLGVATSAPTQALHVAGNARITGALFDSLNTPGASGQVLVSTSGGVEWRTSSGGIDGTGSANYLARWIDADTLGTGIVYDNGTNVGVRTTAPSTTLDVRGTGYFSESVRTSGTVVFASGNTGTVGVMQWNDGEGTVQLGLKGGNVNVELAQDNVVLCYNGVGSSLSKGQVVYASGAQGQRPSVNLALATSDLTSARTIGLVDETIGVGAEGFVATFGVVTNLNTSALTAGSGLWLSATTPGAITMTRPVAPNHGVFLGWCLNSHVSAGRIFVNVQNGVELEEIHDVLIQSVASGNLLQYDSSNSTWRNRTPLQAGLVEGVGTSGYAARWISANVIGTGVVYDNGTNVGIGTTSPTAKLHIETGSGTTSGILVRGAFGQTADYLRVQDSSSGNVMRLANNAELYLGAGSGVTITAGLIKIGEDPSASAGGKFFVIYNTYSNINSYERLNIGWRAAPYDTNVAYISTENSLGGTIRDIAITHDDYTAVGADTMRFKAATQFVGVCNESPTARLHINAASSTVTGVIIQGAASQSAELFRVQDSAANALVRVDAAGSISGVGSGIFMQRVGVGTSAPTQALHVSGNARLTGSLFDSLNLPGASGQIFVSTSGATEWKDASSIGLVSATGVANKVAFFSSASSLSSNNNFHWDDTNARLAIGKTSAQSKLDVLLTGAVTATTTGVFLNNNSTSSTNSINRLGLWVACTGAWTGTATNVQGITSRSSGGTNTYGINILASGSSANLYGFRSEVELAATETLAAGNWIFVHNDGVNVTNNRTYYGSYINISDSEATATDITSYGNYITATFSAGTSSGNKYGVFTNLSVPVASSGYGYYLQGLNIDYGLYISNETQNYLSSRLGINQTSPTAMLHLQPTSSTVTGVIIRGAASQTADLLQIQNSAGETLLDVDFAGSISGVGSGIFGQNLRVANIPAGTTETDVVLVKTDGTFVKRPSSSLGVGGGSGISNEDSIINALIFG